IVLPDLFSALQKQDLDQNADIKMDMLIAAHAKSRGLILVTHNVREFERVEGLVLENRAQ
ncbi:MAG: hypothetical protein FWF04_04985, partial [Clostridiales bacterium]|nr:hypothetical protein [Clostridiales bacterium]